LAFKEMSMGKIYTIEEIRDIVVPIAKAYSVPKLALFGSVAKGQATLESDIDLIIEKGSYIRGLFLFCEFAEKLEEALQKKVDILTYGGLSEHFSYITNEEVVLYESQ